MYTALNAISIIFLSIAIIFGSIGDSHRNNQIEDLTKRIEQIEVQK